MNRVAWRIVTGLMLRSPEDFIDKLASKSISGDEYAIVHPDGKREPLAPWLHAALAEYRAAQSAATRPAQ